jgi:hypothetical protein
MPRLKVEHCWKLDVMDVRACLKALTPQHHSGGERRGYAGDFHVERTEQGEFRVRVWVRSRHLTEQLRLLATMPFLGGRRFWFACPRCRRRCRVVYLPSSSTRFGCRLCLSLWYQSQSRNSQAQYWRTIIALRRRLGARAPYVTSPTPPAPVRPRGMHRKTYAKLVHKLQIKESIYENLVRLQAQRVQGRRSR